MQAKIASPIKSAAFQFEADMVPYLHEALPRLTFRHETRSPVKVFTEVPAIRGVPDLVGVRFIPSNIDKRASAGVLPLSTDIEVRTISAFNSETLSAEELAKRAKVSLNYMRGAIIPLLEELGWVGSRGTNYFRRPEAVWVARRIVTVEAKLKDWRSALTQARNQSRSADAAYIALDSTKTAPMHPYLQDIAINGIGVMVVDKSMGRCHVLVRPAPNVDNDAVGKHLLAERCLEMMQRGSYQGQIHPVFGRTPPVSSQ